ncbi:unnamed protein product [Moneuplotes crassus]|uniref:Uncharacterized protein n=1 Tax=Euplotes crassus TaxID=5936 RepID=A0AAD1Y1P5_EUPCR|nr:unnamed protein product [Moneuplotes crassus]
MSMYHVKLKNTNKSYKTELSGLKLTLNIANIKRKPVLNMKSGPKRNQICLKKKPLAFMNKTKARMLSPNPPRMNFEFPQINNTEKPKRKCRRKWRSPVSSTEKSQLAKMKTPSQKKPHYSKCRTRVMNQTIGEPCEPQNGQLKRTRTRTFSQEVIQENSTIMGQAEENESIKFTYECKIRNKLNIARRCRAFLSPVVLRTKISEMCSLPKFTSPRHYVAEQALKKRCDLEDTDCITLDTRTAFQDDDFNSRVNHNLSNFSLDKHSIAPKIKRSHIKSCDMALE